MLKYLLTILTIGPSALYSQNLPAYTFTIYDSSVTGYYFVSAIKLGNLAGITPAALILDGKGEIVYYKPFSPLDEALDFKLLPNGKISYFNNTKYHILDSAFNVIDSVVPVGYPSDNHDLQVTTNNHYLILGVKDTMMDLTSYHYFNHTGAPGSPNAIVRGQIIQELDSNKNVVFEWNAFDHYQFSDVSPYWLYDPANVDWTHCNAVEMDIDGNILISTRHFNEITKIDHASGSIIWRMGGSQNQFTFYNEPFIFRGQHDVRRLPNGNITLFDNGRFFVSHGARAVEYQVDEGSKTATLIWSYMHDSTRYSLATGNVQRVSGNRSLVDFGAYLNSNLCFAFVDSFNNPYSELAFTDSSFSYRSFFYPVLPWSFNRPQINCYQQGTDFYLETTATYSSYLWLTGDTASFIKITSPGIYYVAVPYGEGFIRSEKFIVTNVSNPCNTNSMNEIENESAFFISPNPAKDNLTITNKGLKEMSDIKIYDVFSREIFSGTGTAGKEKTFSIDVRNWNNGIYFLHVGNTSVKFIKN